MTTQGPSTFRRKVTAGNELGQEPPGLFMQGARCVFPGQGRDGRPARVPLSDDVLSKHVLMLGEIGSGKTNTIFHLISQLRRSMTADDVMVIFDTKGDFYTQFYRPGDIVVSNDDKATGPVGADYWNIFREVGLDTALEENILEITRSLFHERSERSSQPFFPNAAKDIFAGIMLHYYRTDPQGANNATLRTFLDQSPSSEIRALLGQHDDLKAMVNYIADDRSPQTQGVISELQQMVREIFVGSFRKAGTLSMRQAVRNKGGRLVFVEYDLGMGGVLTPIYRLLIDLAIKEALCRSKSEGNVWFIIDEFRLVPNLQHVDDGVNFGRSLGAKFVIGVQNVEQVFDAYGQAMARSILSGFLTTVSFRVNDPATRTFVQELYGKNRVYEASPSMQSGKGLMEQVRDANVVEDWDVLRLPVGQAIISLPGTEPFLFRFDRYA